VVERIVAVGDPRVSEYLGVSEPQLLKSRGLFIAEGRIVVTRLLESGDWTLRSLLLSEAAYRDLEPVLAAARDRAPVFICASRDFLEITGHHIHRGCLALVECRPEKPLDEAARDSRLAVVLEGVANADNVGGVFRNVAAFGGDLVVLSPACCSPLYRKAIRTSMGATLRVPFVHLLDDWPAALTRLRAAGFDLVAMTLSESSQTLEAFASHHGSERLALVVGAEGVGLTPAVESEADYRVRIPIAPSVDSLNLAVATGIALERLTRNGHGRGILAGPKSIQT